MLIPIFKDHNEQIKKLIGVDFSYGTLDRYKTSLWPIESFLQWKFNILDTDIRKINYDFISDNELWLKTICHDRKVVYRAES